MSSSCQILQLSLESALDNKKSPEASVGILRKIIYIFQTSSTTTTTKMTTNQKLYGKDLSAYDEVDVDTLLSQLSPEEINILAKEVDPDVSTLTISNSTRIVS